MFKQSILLLLLFNLLINGVDIGSDTAVTRFNNQVAIAQQDVRIAGFAGLDGGFLLSDSATAVLFDSFFSLSGNIQLNSGTLNLNQDLILQDETDIISLGNINGNYHRIDCSPAVQTIPSGGAQLGCTIAFVTDETQPDLANEVDWSPDSQYVVVAIDDAGGANTQIRIYSFDGSTLTFIVGVDVGGDVNTVSWHPTNDWIAFGRDSGGGSELYIYEFDRGAGTLSLLSSADIANTVNSVVWHPAGGHLALGSNNNAIRVRVYVVDSAGVLGANVTVNPGADANAVDWSVDGTLLGVGTDAQGGPAAELYVYIFDEGALTLTLNASVNVANQVNSVAWNKIFGNNDLIAVGVNAGTGRVRVYRHDSGAGTLTLLTAAQAINATIVNFVDWHPLYNCLAACLNVNAEGTGGEIRIYGFSDDALAQEDSEELGDSVFGGRWSRNGRYFGSADDGGGPGGPELSIYQVESQVLTGCAITFLTDATQLDFANEVDWSPDSQYVVVGIDDAGGASDQVLVYSFNGSTLTFIDGVDVGGDVNTVSWHPTNDWIAFGRDSGGGSEVYIYSFDRNAGTLSLLSSAGIADIVQSVVWHPAGAHLAIGTDDNAIRVRVYVVSGGGVLGASVTVNPGADVNAVDWNAAGTALAVGTDAFGGNELQVYTFTPTPLTLTLNAGSNVANQVNSVSWNTVSGNTDLIALGVNAGTGRVRVYRHNSGAGTLTLLAGAQAIDATIVNFVDWHPVASCLAACLNVSTEGTGGEIRIYGFASDTLTQDDNVELGDSVFGGRWSRDGDYFASADNGGGSPSPELSVFKFDPFFRNDFLFTNLKWFINNNLTLQDCRITFTGDNLLNGRDNCLTLMPTFTLRIGSKGSLLMQNMRVEGINADSIQMVDSTSTISFENCTFILDEDVTIDTGKLEVLQEFKIQGEGSTFCYASDQVCKIYDEGILFVDNGVTFSYDPSIASNSLLVFTNINSLIHLQSSTLFASDVGLQLTKGTIQIDGKSYLSNSGSSSSEGIILGDGISAANNMCIEFDPAANLEILNGFFTNNNV